jgi:hypothetical protein
MGCHQASRVSARSQLGWQQQQRLQTAVSLPPFLGVFTVLTLLQQAVTQQQQQLLQLWWEKVICTAAGVQLAQQRLQQQQQATG